jgi:hypothetical protein
LHTHVVVANATQAADGRWTALDGRALYRHAKTAGYLYQAVLRAELSERLSVRWLAVERGTADLACVPRGVIEHFSQRRAEILEHMAARGERSARAPQVATLETRRSKPRDVPAERLRAEWRARAAEHGLDRLQLRRVFRQPPRRSLDEVALFEELARRLEGSEGLTRDRSRFARRDVVQAFAEAAARGARVAEIERRATAFLDRDEIVALESGSREREYTTRSLLLIERELLGGAEGRRATGVAVAEAEAIRAAFDARRSLSSEQRDLVVALTRSGDGVQIVRSAAGTGKTFALGAAVDAWQASGTAVLGCSLSARAACELRDQTGVDAKTIARLRRALDERVELSAGAVLIVDEAGMVGTRDLAALTVAAQRANAKLVLVGDDHQLPELQAGGAFAALARQLGAVELREVRRQCHAWDRAALAALRAGDGDAFARAYVEQGRIVAAPSAEAARTAMVDDWHAAYESGATAIMIAHRRADVADLNARAREKLRALGRLGDHQVAIGTRTFARGDRVVTKRNDRRLNVVNGQAGVITAIDGGRCEVRFDDGRDLQLPERYVREGHLDHGYASTAHRAQGATVDRTFVLGSDELYREWGYTALSRHRQGTRFYVTAAQSFINASPTPLQGGEDAGLRAAQMLAASQAKQLAGEGIDRSAAAELDAVKRRLGDLQAHMTILRDERQRLRWHQRGRRARVDISSTGCQREHWSLQREAARLSERPSPIRPQPTLERAQDPLATFRSTSKRTRQRGFGREL